MKNWKKGIVTLAALVFLAACTGTTEKKEERTKEETRGVTVVASIYPLYDWARILAEGTSIETEYLVDHGDLHAYEPSAEDIVKARAAGLVLAIGGADEDLAKLDGVHALVMTDVVKDALLPSTDHDHAHGDEDEDHDHDHEHEHEEKDHDHEHEEKDHDHEHEEKGHDHEEAGHAHHHHHDFDEHVWLSPELARRMVAAIADEMGKLSPADRARIDENCDRYLEKLLDLRRAYEDFAGTHPRLVFADRFPFRYLEDTYDWDVVAAYRGCSADAEVSVDTMKELVDAAEGRPYVLVEARGDGKIAKTVTEASSAKTIAFDTMEAVSRDETRSYLDIMRENLEHFKEAAK